MVHVVGVTRFYVTITRPCPLDATIKTTQPAERPTDRRPSWPSTTHTQSRPWAIDRMQATLARSSGRVEWVGHGGEQYRALTDAAHPSR